MMNSDRNDDHGLDRLDFGSYDQSRKHDASASDHLLMRTSEDDRLNLDAPNPKGKSGKKKRGFFGWLVRFLLTIFFFGVLAATGGGYMLYHWASEDLPSFSKIADYRPPLVTTVLARDGSLIGQFYRERRFLVTLDQLPKFVPQAFLAVEDDQFYNHPGIDIKAILRAAIANFQSGGTKQGGSTITQQVVKRLMLTPEKSYERKLKEAILAYRLEKQLSKDEILTLYINQIFLGNNSYGIEAAARSYFAKHARDLTIAEAALIAGLGQSPSAYNPYRNPGAAQTRQRHALRRLRDLGWINDAEYDAAINQKLEFKSMPGSDPNGGWYLEEVRRLLVDMFSEENCRRNGYDFGLYGEDAVYELGLTVHTAMDPIQQKAASSGLRHGLEDATKRHGWLGPVEHIEPSQYTEFLKKNNFRLSDLDHGGWAQALVISVNKSGAQVQLSSDQKGYVSVKTMNWARKPNKRVAGSVSAVVVSDAAKVVRPGDVIWVSRSSASPSVQTRNTKSKDIVEAPQGTENTSRPQENIIDLKLQQMPDVQGAMISIEPESGDVVAMTGGYAFGSSGSHFNRATQAQRQPGSSFKPIVYSAALDHGFTPASMLLDAPIILIDKWTQKAWRPGNSDGKFLGPLPLWNALARSRNLCTIRIAQQMGIEHVVARAKALRLAPDFPSTLAICLGAVAVSPLNMAQAYTAFANEGKVSSPRFITSIQGPWGNTIYECQPEHVQAITPQNAYIMANLLKGVVTSGTGSKAKVLNRPLGGKTGTTNDENDAWFLAVTPHLVTATYIGYDQLQPMGRGEGGSGAALPAYLYYAQDALKAYPPDDFRRPEGIVSADAGGAVMPFIEGTEPGTGYGLNAMDRAAADSNAEEQAKQGEDFLKELF
jgi:penicillin-binding protein 1A